MEKFNKNIWTIFYILILISAISFAYLINDKRNELIQDLKHEQAHLTSLLNNEATIIFSQFDSILDLIASNYKVGQNIDSLPLQGLLEKNQLFSDIYLFSASGRYLTSTGAITDVHIHEKIPETPLFSKVIQVDQMLIGLPVFIPSKNDWIIPVKKRVLDEKQQVIAVIDMHISRKYLSKAWEDNYQDLMLEMITDDDFSSIFKANILEEKKKGLDKEHASFHELRTDLHAYKTQLQSSQASVSYPFFPTIKNTEKNSVAFVYNYPYKLWISTTYLTKNIDKKLTKVAISYSLIYFYILVVFWGAFKWVTILSNKAYLNLIYTNEHRNLTGLYNRKVLSRWITKKQQNKQPFTLLYLNLINFKKINDTFGYQYGDTILKEVAKRITESFKNENGIVTHFSGDDFVILMETTDKNSITIYLKKLLNTIHNPYRNLYNSFVVSASVGVLRVNKDINYLHNSTLDKLINFSEKAMLIAKHDPLKYTFFSEDIYEDTRCTIRYEEALTGAIANNELSLVYQPQLNRDGKLIGVEALIRWNSPQLGNVSPEIFIPIAEELNLMPLLGPFIIENALNELSNLQSKLNFSCSLSVNVSAQQFLQQDFLPSLLASYQKYQSPYLDFIVEITENLFIENIQQLLPIFKALKDYDIGLSLDDFGTGYSSLSMLKSLPVDELKIDKTFVDHIVDNELDKVILEKIVDIGKALNLRVVAEGVETKAQLTILKNMKCDILQGYYHSKPLKIDDLELYIQDTQTK